MKVEDLILVSIDDHVVEPPDMFDRHTPAKYRDRVPHVVKGDDGIEKWLFEGQQIGSMGLNAVVTWPKEEWGFDPVGFAEMRPGAYDIHERVRDMNRNGILASMCFPDVRRVRGRHVPGSGRQGPGAGHRPGLQRLAHRRVVRGVPRPVHPARHPADLGPAAGGRRGAARRGQGVPGDHHARAAAHPGPAQLHQHRLLGPVLPRCRRSRS